MNSTTQGMPNGVRSLYIIQAFSTFSYAVLYASLSLYLTKQLGLSIIVSNSIVGIFLAFNYALHLVGGLIGGHYLSNRVLFLVTTIIQSIGILFLALLQNYLYIGLSFFLIGCGLNTTCYNSLLTQRFQAEDTRRDKAFFWSYATMNIGFFAGFIISGLYDQSNHYEQLFYVCAIINILTVFLIVYSWKSLSDQGTSLSQDKNTRTKNLLGIIGILILIPVLNRSFNSASLSNYLVIVMSIIMFFVILLLGFKQKTKIDRQKIMAYLILTVTSIVFWMIYFTGPMGVTHFIKNNVDKHFWGYELPTQWILNINSILIIIGAPLMAFIISKLQSRGYKLTISTQFLWAFITLCLSFLFLGCGIFYANALGYIGVSWVVLHFIAQSIAELLIGPVGYAMIGRIAPIKLQGILMGTWMMVSGVSASLSHYFSNAMVKAESSDPLLTNVDYLHVFIQLSIWALIGAVFLYLISEKIRGLIDNVNEPKDSPIEVTQLN
ncbi:peptide MFS transporter [Legionella longbeachae]|uniref:peptide MFS transporter n=1 Tax=Legionella longbeachae TaxID=450 RepID=UPI0001BEBCA5|nr:oligopeptide:H+ symporter [Legionella longbeachae]EEZ95967.1 proton/peptide symporter family protein [Legionella longbeachae D-4968]